MNGQYAFSFFGYSANNQTPNVVAGSLTMNSNGNVTGGEFDSLNPTNNGGYQFGTVTGGTYSVGSDGLGQIMFTDNLGDDVQLLIALGSGENIRIISMNTSGNSGFWGAGVSGSRIRLPLALRRLRAAGPLGCRASIP